MFTQEFTLTTGNKVTLNLGSSIPTALSWSEADNRLRLMHPTHNNGGWSLCTKTHSYQSVNAILRSVKG